MMRPSQRLHGFGSWLYCIGQRNSLQRSKDQISSSIHPKTAPTTCNKCACLKMQYSLRLGHLRSRKPREYERTLASASRTHRSYRLLCQQNHGTCKTSSPQTIYTNDYNLYSNCRRSSRPRHTFFVYKRIQQRSLYD